MTEPDEVTQGWWDATRERRLVLQRCRSCRRWQHYPRALCLGCGGLDLAFESAAGTGTIDTFTRVHRAPRPDLEVPYVVARVRLAEGPVLLSNLVGPAALGDDDLIGRPVTVDWRPLPDGRHLPIFTL